MGKTAVKYLKTEPWRIVEEGFHANRSKVSESVFSLANEYCGVRGIVDEGADAESLQGAYFNGIYEWEQKENPAAYRGIVGRGHYMVNAADWLSCTLSVDGERCRVSEGVSGFVRVLDMRGGLLSHSYIYATARGKIKISFERFLSMESCENSFRRISLEADHDAEAELVLPVSFATRHWGRDGYWKVSDRAVFENGFALRGDTSTTGQSVFSGMAAQLPEGAVSSICDGEKSRAMCLKIFLKADKPEQITQYFYNLADKTGERSRAGLQECVEGAKSARIKGYEEALKENEKYWEKFWKRSDIVVEGDDEDQQGIRFCIFQLQQTYHGQNPKNNIGAKGLTGEAYSGHAFWDTETYCLPYYLFNNPEAAKDLLLFRYHTLAQAKERAKMLDCEGACYPIATLNGAEACALWQHASLQFQPSTGVAYGIRHYVNVTGDEGFLAGYGFEMLLEISRFLMSRGDFNADRTKFGFYCVMGPDEFQMMVNHNVYTNYMAKKTFEYTAEVAKRLKNTAPKAYKRTIEKTGFSETEFALMKECAEKTYILYDEKTHLFEQHQNYFDLPHVDVHSIPASEFPLYHHWSYDRIYRNDMIKQPDILMMIFLHGGDFSFEEKKANYEFYEPRCIHESSLSPSVHSILAAELKKEKEAIGFFGFATRMDLDDYNRNSGEGLHTTSIAAAWLNVVYGFGGLRSDGKILKINPTIPDRWKSYSFRFLYRGNVISVRVEHGKTELTSTHVSDVELLIGEEKAVLKEKLVLGAV